MTYQEERRQAATRITGAAERLAAALPAAIELSRDLNDSTVYGAFLTLPEGHRLWLNPASWNEPDKLRLAVVWPRSPITGDVWSRLAAPSMKFRHDRTPTGEVQRKLLTPEVKAEWARLLGRYADEIAEAAQAEAWRKVIAETWGGMRSHDNGGGMIHSPQPYNPGASFALDANRPKGRVTVDLPRDPVKLRALLLAVQESLKT